MADWATLDAAGAQNGAQDEWQQKYWESPPANGTVSAGSSVRTKGTNASGDSALLRRSRTYHVKTPIKVENSKANVQKTTKTQHPQQKGKTTQGHHNHNNHKLPPLQIPRKVTDIPQGRNQMQNKWDESGHSGTDTLTSLTSSVTRSGTSGKGTLSRTSSSHRVLEEIGNAPAKTVSSTNVHPISYHRSRSSRRVVRATQGNQQGTKNVPANQNGQQAFRGTQNAPSSSRIKYYEQLWQKGDPPGDEGVQEVSAHERQAQRLDTPETSFSGSSSSGSVSLTERNGNNELEWCSREGRYIRIDEHGTDPIVHEKRLHPASHYRNAHGLIPIDIERRIEQVLPVFDENGNRIGHKHVTHRTHHIRRIHHKDFVEAVSPDNVSYRTYSFRNSQ